VLDHLTHPNILLAFGQWSQGIVTIKYGTTAGHDALVHQSNPDSLLARSNGCPAASKATADYQNICIYYLKIIISHLVAASLGCVMQDLYRKSPMEGLMMSVSHIDNSRSY
jgi:hypothetical protein